MKCTVILVKKNYCWIWIAVDRCKKKFVDFELGDRGIKTGKKLWKKLKIMDKKTIVATDYWKAYEHFIPKNRHIQSKAETFTVEGYNSLFRHFLARMRRKSKCYSKSIKMLEYSILLLMMKRNNTLTILN
jgi:insertion element IS1 protein InsB